MIKKTVVLLIAISLFACSSIKSIKIPPLAADKKPYSFDGLTYFMPKKDFLVTITIKGEDQNGEKQISKVTLGTTASYPDLSEQYVLRYRKNLLGKNTLDVSINEAGLLTSTKSTTVSNVADVFKNLAAIAGTVSVFGLKIEKPKTPKEPEPCVPSVSCETVGDHSFRLKEPGSCTVCGMTINIQRLGEFDGVQHSKTAGEEYPGIFYRQNIPYIITAVGSGLNAASLVFSPSQSNVHFLPVSRTFFSNNDADFQFVEGIPTKYKQDTDGELVALSKIPADVVGAYFTAIGTVFDSFKSKSQKEEQALTESLKLELAEKKYDACISAINAGKDELIKQYCQ